MRDDAADGTYPLILISHGWLGNRFLLSHLGKNFASKGYAVASIDHTESTYDTFQVPDCSLRSARPRSIARSINSLF